MSIAKFLLQDKYGRDHFFEEIFLLAYKSMEVILEMLFFTLSNAYI